MKKFTIKPYGIQELALWYFPNNTPGSASQQLMKWVNHNRFLTEDLKATDYRPGQKILTPRQVSLIVTHLGEPDM